MLEHFEFTGVIMSELAVLNKKRKPLKSFKQLSMFEPISPQFGGSLLIGKRKSKRPMTTKKALHLIIKGDISVSGSLVVKRNWINKEAKKLAKKFSIIIYGDPGIERNHIHFTIKISSIENYKKFIRALTGRLAQVLKIKFIYRPFTKIIEWGRQFETTIGYCLQNKEEALGVRPYNPRHKRRSIPKVKQRPAPHVASEKSVNVKSTPHQTVQSRATKFACRSTLRPPPSNDRAKKPSHALKHWAQ